MLKVFQKLSPSQKSYLILGLFFLATVIFGIRTDFQKDSESLVVAKMNQVREQPNKVFSPPLLLRCEATDSQNLAQDDWIDAPYRCLNKLCTCSYSEYMSHFGLNGFFSSALDHFLHLDLTLQRILYASLTGLLLCLIILSIQETSLISGYLFMGLSLITLTWQKFSANLYWVSWLWLLLIYSLIKLRGRSRILVVFFLTLLRFLVGAEYASNIILLPLIFLTWEYTHNELSFRELIKQGFTFLCTQTLAFFLALTGWIFAVRSVRNQDFQEFIRHVIFKRLSSTTDPKMLEQIEPIYHESIKAGYFETLFPYFYINGYWILFLGIAVTILYSYFRLNYRPGQYAYLTVAFFSAISWLVLAKAHSYIHTPINFIVWEISLTVPTALFIGEVLERRASLKGHS